MIAKELCLAPMTHLIRWAIMAFVFQVNTVIAEPLDILNIRLGDALEITEQRMQAHFDGRGYKRYYLNSRSESSTGPSSEIIFTDGLLYVSDLRGEYSRTEVPFSEMLIVFFDDQSTGDPIIAVSRVLGLSHYSMSIEDMELGMFDKYGRPGRIRNWDIFGTDYMWASDQHIQSELISEPRDWNYIRDFEDNCSLLPSSGLRDFTPGQLNEIWRDEENNALPISFFFSSQEIHRFREIERKLEGPSWTYLEEDERIAKIEGIFLEHRSERRQCGEALIVNIDLWRRGGPGQRAVFYLYDQGTILDLHDRWSREADSRPISGTGSAPIDF